MSFYETRWITCCFELVDDNYHRRKKGETDKLFEALNTYHPNIKLTIEVNPSRFLDTHLSRNDDRLYTYSVFNKESKLPFHWSSKVPTQYKRSIIKGELYRAYRIGSSFNDELQRIRKKFKAAGYPSRFIEAQINTFKLNLTDEILIPKWLFEEDKMKVFIQIPYCPKMKYLSRN